MKLKKFAMLAGIPVVLAGLNFMPTPAAAQVEFNLRNGDVRVARPDEDGQYDHYDRRYDRRSERPRCSPRAALEAASRYLNSPQISSVNRGYYEIDGYGKRGGARNSMDGVRISTSDCRRVR